jgi:uncharacterized protein (UPF0305 family)
MAEKPNISDDFTIDDIHKIREYLYETRKNMTFEEKKADIAKGSDAMMARIEAIRKERLLAVNQ